MTVADRKKQLRIVTEMLLVHLPSVLNTQSPPETRAASYGSSCGLDLEQAGQADQELARDLLTIVSLAIRAAAADAEKSAVAWDKRAYHIKADELRREWEWAPGAGNYAMGLADRADPITVANLEKLRALIGAPLERPTRLRYKDPTAFLGAHEANRQRERREGRQTPKRSLV
jgi:hypothetical protein